MSEQFNIVTVGDTYKATVKCDNVNHAIAFYVGTRAGATSGMILETVRHFIHALCRVADGDLICLDGFDKRSENLPTVHGEARVSIWVKSPGVPVLMVDGMRFIQVNIFTEETSAQNFIDAVWEHVTAMNTIIATGAVSLQSPGRKAQVPVPQAAPTAPPAKSELDKHFSDKPQAPMAATAGRTPATNPPPPAPPTDNSTPPPAPGDSVIDLDYDYKQKAQYEQDYTGRTVRVLVKKIQWCIEAKKDKSGSYEMIQLFKESHYENPIYDLGIWPPKPEDKYGNGKALMRGLPDGVLSKPGDYIEGDIYINYKLNKSDNGKVYWNITNVDCQNMAQAPSPIVPGEEEIPF